MSGYDEAKKTLLDAKDGGQAYRIALQLGWTGQMLVRVYQQALAAERERVKQAKHETHTVSLSLMKQRDAANDLVRNLTSDIEDAKMDAAQDQMLRHDVARLEGEVAAGQTLRQELDRQLDVLRGEGLRADRAELAQAHERKLGDRAAGELEELEQSLAAERNRSDGWKRRCQEMADVADRELKAANRRTGRTEGERDLHRAESEIRQRYATGMDDACDAAENRIAKAVEVLERRQMYPDDTAMIRGALAILRGEKGGE